MHLKTAVVVLFLKKVILKKSVTYTATNSYDTLNTYTSKTKNVWLVFHGIGYLSRFFIRHFNQLDTEENYIICPQAPSKYYKDTSYKRVGASWLTREDTIAETENVLNYVDAILGEENINYNNINFIVLGYSQGVSIATRWLANRKQFCDRLVMISGVFPKELSPTSFNHLPKLKTFHTVGTHDEIFDPKNVTKQEDRLVSYFPNITIVNHDGGHILDNTLLERYIN